MTELEKERERKVGKEYTYEEYIRLWDEGEISDDLGWAEFYNNKSGEELSFTPLDYDQWTYWQDYKFDIKKNENNPEEKPNIFVLDVETQEVFSLEDFIKKQYNIAVEDVAVIWISSSNL